jgi:[acyl-carrier-protein] S-malonyltransferase
LSSTWQPRSPREAAQGEVCDAANDNGGAQVVVSGNKSAVERAVQIAQGRGASAP